MKNQIKNKKAVAIVKVSLFFLVLTFVCTVYGGVILENETVQNQTTAAIEMINSGWVATCDADAEKLSWIYKESGVSGKRLGKAGDLTYVVYSQCDSKGETTREVIVAQTSNVGAEFDIANFPQYMEATAENMELALLETR